MLKHEGVQSSVENLYAEKELRKSGDKFQTLINLMPDPVVIVDGKGNFLAVNDKVEEKTGFKREELLRKNFLRTKIMTAKSKAILMKNLARRMMGMHVAPYEVEALTKDGKKIAVEINAAKIQYKGKPADLVIFRDITERKKAEEKLRFLKEFNERVVDSIGGALLVIDPSDYTVISANEAALKQLKLRKEDLIGKTCYETAHHRSTPCKPPHDICPIQEMSKTGKAVTVEHTHFDKDNNEIYVEVSASPMSNQEGKIIQVVHIARDITERKKAEEKLVRLSSAVKMSTDSIVISGIDGKIIDVNEATLKMYGTDDKGDLIGKNSFDLIVPEDREKASAGIKEVLKKG